MTHDAESALLPPFGVRRSARARRIRLTVSVREGLIVTLPHGVPEKAALQAVSARAAWARRHLASTAARRAAVTASPEAQLPSLVELRAFGESWPVEYRQGSGTGTRAVCRGAALVVSGDTDDARACLDALRRWRDRTAREGLVRVLDEVSSALAIPYARVAVRGQRTRWGSCSSAGSISLNRNLVFLPEHLVRYVCAHELTHIEQTNHSPRFWSRLHAHWPTSPAARTQMRSAATYVPAWAEN